jgi:hypothetical protein
LPRAISGVMFGPGKQRRLRPTTPRIALMLLQHPIPEYLSGEANDPLSSSFLR